MKLNEALKKLAEKKILLILLVVGIIIMLISENTEKKTQDIAVTKENTNRIEAKELKNIIKKIGGVKSCEVYVTYDNHGQTNFAYDVSTGTNTQMEIKLNDDEPLIKSTDNPKMRGIFELIEGDGIDSGEITQIVKAATGTPLHRIYVKLSGGNKF